MKKLIGSKILNNYRGNLDITTSNCSVVVKDAQDTELTAGNRKLKIDDYSINVTPRTGFLLEDLKLNNQSIQNNSTHNLSFGQNFNINATAVWDGVTSIFDPIFANNTPQILSSISAEISANNYTADDVAQIYGWNLGDTVPVTLTTGETIELQLIGVNHDNKSDGSGKAGLTLYMKNCLNTRYGVNSVALLNIGYLDTEMRNTTLPNVKSTLPQEWQEILLTVNKKCANGGLNNYTGVIDSPEDIFLLSATEFGFDYMYDLTGGTEGSAYEYWERNNTNSARIKYRGSSATAIVYVLRTPSNYGSGYICDINAAGAINRTSATSTTRGLAFAICI